ncbi:hypothetical protein C8R44DRAFT_708179 [Mycena epipterygia]|nr:hypothetical protein C8R44DRAFT_708179 [Mycena epipterygia]
MSNAVVPVCNNEDPFNDVAADIIVRSSTDNVDFRVHKAFLAIASPVFRDMLSLPQPGDIQTDASGVHMKDGLHIVPVDEDKATLGTLLRMCYPAWMLLDCEQLFPTTEILLAVFVAARKYAMDGIERQVRAELVAPRFIDPNPLRIYALAVQHGLFDEAKICAKYTLRTPVLGRDYIAELESITAGAYHRLQEYHIECGHISHDLAKNVQWIANETWVWFECSMCRGNSQVVISGERRKWVARWWAQFMLEASAALKKRPSGVTVAIDSEVVHTAIEQASACGTCRSRVFREMREFCGLFVAEVEKETGKVSWTYSDFRCIEVKFFDPGGISAIELSAARLPVAAGSTAS